MRIVSGSRISPTTMTSGACRRAPAARWENRARRGRSRSARRGSCGAGARTRSDLRSSRCAAASRLLISSTSAASVVLLPEPVGPPIRTSPRGRRLSASTPGGRPSDARRGTWSAGPAHRRCGAPALLMEVDAEPPEASLLEGAVGDPGVRVPARAMGERRAGTFASAISSPSVSSASGRTLPSNATEGARRHEQQDRCAVARRRARARTSGARYCKSRAASARRQR